VTLRQAYLTYLAAMATAIVVEIGVLRAGSSIVMARGAAFDPRVVDAFVALSGSGELCPCGVPAR
jgi:hypothetical protein